MKWETHRKLVPIEYLASILITLVLLLAGCSPSTPRCSEQDYEDLSEAAKFAQDFQLPFRFPMDDFKNEASKSYTHFCAASSGPIKKRKYHAAEDFFRPAGSAVYAIADGVVSFSGPMGGYGWLVIIDHPQANLYSLYGHLSPSRWQIKPGPVKKGDQIGYLGDEYENGGSLEQPLEPHLHLGIRAGQRSDYPANGEWRWQAGWIKPFPSALGWLKPTKIITDQAIPSGGFPEPESSFLAKWWTEMLFGYVYFVGGISVMIYATRKDKPHLLIITGVVLFVVGWFFYQDGWRMSIALFPVGGLLLVIGIYLLTKRFWIKQ